MWKIVVVLVSILVLLPSVASAQSVIRREGAHPAYATEVEPHVIVEVPEGLGVGARLSFNVADQGFINRLNDSVAVGVGGDVALQRNRELIIPVVMQWNFWFTPKWSAFGEPGFALRFSHKNRVHPHIGVGGRYMLTDSVALTLRAGWPASSVGVSFFL
jgi:hypothetical protein